MKSKSLALLLVTMTLTTQTGCIVGIATANPYYILGGIGVAAFGFHPWVLGGYDMDAGGKVMTLAVGIAGIALDGENPGRSEALNWVPVDEANAKKFSTNVQALEAYNDELGQVIRANDAIELDLAPIANGKAHEADLHQLARTVGMTDSAELKRVLSGERLSRDHLKRFADQYSMSEETARIYLKLRFDIKSAN